MTQIKLDKSLAEELITSKLHIIQKHIDTILNRWNDSNAKNFLEKARSGIHKNAEDDAVELHQLLLDYKKFKDILNTL